MPTILSHIAVPLALSFGLGKKQISPRLMCAGLVASVLPDADVLGFRFGVEYAHALGHRGISHSLLFAVLVGLLACIFSSRLRTSRFTALWFIFVCTVSHPLLDMCTTGGLGVSLWWPLSDARIFFEHWQVIRVSPLSLKGLMGARGLVVLKSELLWVWLPCSAMTLMLFLLTWRGCRSR
jgi:inner membrane protein